MSRPNDVPLLLALVSLCAFRVTSALRAPVLDLGVAEKREQAARSMKALNGEWTSGSTYDMALRIHTFADPPSPTSRDEPWRP